MAGVPKFEFYIDKLNAA